MLGISRIPNKIVKKKGKNSFIVFKNDEEPINTVTFNKKG